MRPGKRTGENDKQEEHMLSENTLGQMKNAYPELLIQLHCSISNDECWFYMLFPPLKIPKLVLSIN